MKTKIEWNFIIKTEEMEINLNPFSKFKFIYLEKKDEIIKRYNINFLRIIDILKNEKNEKDLLEEIEEFKKENIKIKQSIHQCNIEIVNIREEKSTLKRKLHSLINDNEKLKDELYDLKNKE
jgi:predicted RNase H-like nuclease (RuvC/YqgF family)